MTSVPAPKSKSLKIPAVNPFKAIKTANPSTGGPSYISLFITNLRLLNLDLRRDWPNITALTFSTRNAQQNQKKRVECVEWALFQLFALWDPKEAYDKLQPFFPPQEPLQSLNLRQALYRCLESVKKHGALGRDTVLRRTMLDECKGERLEEVLSVFSTAVLKKCIWEAGDDRGYPISVQLAMENFSYTGERFALDGLVIAHKASLSRALASRKESKARYVQFAEFLDAKERQIEERPQSPSIVANSDGPGNMSEYEARELQDVVQKNWSGSDTWRRTIFGGEPIVDDEGILEMPFEKVWRHAERGDIEDVKTQQSTSLLEQLDNKVKEQNHRLENWREFQTTMFLESETVSAKTGPIVDKSQQATINLGFTEHHSLQLSRDVERDTPWSPLQEYLDVIESMKIELANVSKPSPPKPSVGRSKFVTPEAEEIASESDTEELRNQMTSFGDGLDHGESSYERQDIMHSDDSVDEQDTVIHQHDPKRGGHVQDCESDNDEISSLSPTRGYDTVSHGLQVADLTSEKIHDASAAQASRQDELVHESEYEDAALDLIDDYSGDQFYTTPSKNKDLKPASSPTSNFSDFSPLPQYSYEAPPSKPERKEDFGPSSPTPSPSTRAAQKILATMSMTSPSPTKNHHPTPHFPREPCAPFLPSSSSSLSTDQTAESDLTRRTRLSISNLSAMTQRAEMTRRKSVKAMEKAKRDSFLPKRLSTRLEEIEADGLDANEEDEQGMIGRLVDGAVDWEEVDMESAFMSRPKVSMD